MTLTVTRGMSLEWPYLFFLFLQDSSLNHVLDGWEPLLDRQADDPQGQDEAQVQVPRYGPTKDFSGQEC